MPMNKICTLNDLLLYLYNETKMTESVLIQKAIDYDAETEGEFEDLKTAVAYLDKLLETPSKKCIENILKYSKVTSLMQ
ncbi:MAG: hypothetical protein ABI855_20515 [Bacteroidota bacterium]